VPVDLFLPDTFRMLRRNTNLPRSKSGSLLAFAALPFFVFSGGLLPAQVSAAAPSAAPQSAQNEGQNPVDFTADTLVFNEREQIVTATGNVEFIQNEKIVRAQKVTYNLTTEVVKGIGEVTFLEPDGNVYFAKDIEFTKDLADGFAREFRAVLVDGSRFNAETGKRVDANELIMTKASYTPCEPCKKNPEKSPPWQIKAREVVHNAEEKTITYDDATFEAFGVPVAYTPYFSHPDGTEDRKSGFLAPGFSFSSQLGAGVETSYYIDIAPDLDATVGANVYTEQLPLLLGQVRKRFEKAEVEVNGGVTYSDRRLDDGGVTEEARGHLFSQGLWNIDEKWRAGFQTELVSDDQYARQYDITSEDVLDNYIYAERFSGRDYAAIRSLYFQDIRVRERETDQPTILPEIEALFMGDADSFLGGRFSGGFTALGLNKSETGEDSFRVTGDVGWKSRYILPIGLINSVELSARGDSYYTPDRDGVEGQSAYRFYPYAHWETKMPFARDFEDVQAVITPQVALTVAPDIDNENASIPNDDSRDLQIDTSNIFEPNRFPGYDRVEDNSRITYGLRTGLYDRNTNEIEVFLGQSYRFKEDADLFADGSGLEEQKSDYVGEIKASYQDNLSLNYRFQFSGDDFEPIRHEVDSLVAGGPFSLSSTYLYAESLDETDVVDTREQLKTYLTTELSEQWSVTTGAIYDFAEENDGFRRASLGVTYNHQCYTLGATLQKNYTRKRVGESSTEFFVRLGLKNIGEFEG